MSWLSRVVRYTNLHKLITEKDERDDHDGKELARPPLPPRIRSPISVMGVSAVKLQIDYDLPDAVFASPWLAGEIPTTSMQSTSRSR